MSVKIIPASSAAEAQLASSEEGHDCRCRRSIYRDKPGKEFTSGVSVKKESVSLDLGHLLKNTIPDPENPPSIYINCGTVPVEEKRYWDITVFNSYARAKNGYQQQYKTIRIEEDEEDSPARRLGGVFKILNHPNDELLHLVEKNAFGKKAQEKKLSFRILFHPQLANVVYSREFYLWIDDIPLKIKLRGFSIGPSVCLTRNAVNFGGIYFGNRAKRLIDIHNHSASSARFQFAHDGSRSVFQICPTTGVIPPYTTFKAEVIFQPFAARSFYKRIFCLVHHQGPIAIDLVGICIPRPRFLPAPITFAVKMENEVALPSSTDTFSDYVDGDQKWGVTFDVPKIDFGFRDPEESHPDHSSSMPATAVNNLPYEVLLEWVPDPSKVFSVAPAYSIIPPNGGSKVFNVNFKPTFLGSFYDATLECYVFPNGDAWSHEGPPWKLDMTKVNPNPVESSATQLQMTDSQLTTAVFNETSQKDIQEKNKERPYTAEEKASTDKKPIVKEASAFKVPTASSSGFKTAEVSKITSQESRIGPEDQRTEDGYCMKVKVSRLNEGQEVEFNVSPVTERINMYDLPEVILEDESINQIIRKGARMAATDNPCVSNVDLILNNSLRDSKTNVVTGRNSSNAEADRYSFVQSTSTGGEKSSEDKTKETGTTEADEEVVEEIVPSIHPSQVFLVVNEKELTHMALDGVKRIALPLCITLKATGHTFTKQRVPFIPNVKLPLKAMMNTTMPNLPVGRTILVKNLSDLPSVFELEQSDKDENFKVRPSIGSIPGNQHEIIVARINPQGGDSYKGDISMTFNIQDNCLVGLHGYCDLPYLEIKVLYESEEKGVEVVCPITIAGCATYTYMELKNPTGFHYKFWIEPADLEEGDWLSISPQVSSGCIAPNEMVLIPWKFAPRLDGIYYLFWRFCFDVVRTCSSSDSPIGYYEFIIPFTGIAKTSYLYAEPSVIDFDMIQIFDTKSKTITIRNDGECPVNAHLIVHHEQWLTNFPAEIVNVNPARISLKPNESTEVIVTVRPSKTAMQRFYILYNLEFGEEEELVQGATMDVFEKHIVDLAFMGDHTSFKFTDIIMDSPNAVWDAEQCWSMFSVQFLNQLISPQHYITPEGHVPHVSTVTFRFPPAPINAPPSVFKLHLSNVSELRGYWQIFATPPKGWRKHLQQKMCEFCGTSEFKDGHFTDSPDLISQLWAKKFNYHAGDSSKFPSTLNYLKDLALFEITPMSGSLKNKESTILSVKYNFNTLGSHKVSVMLRIFPAIYVWIDISGRTLGPNQPYLQFMNKKHMILHPVSLSDMVPATQMFWVYNGGSVTASFTVDKKPFEKLKNDNFGHAVIECLTTKGEVEPNSWFPIKLRFSPLEYISYSVALIIHPGYEKTSYEVMIHGSAAMNAAMTLRPTVKTENVRKFVLFAHGVPVTLSPSHVTIGHLIPTGHAVTRIIFLTNLHTRNMMRFFWEETPIEGGGMISFHPSCGRLAPKEEISVKMTIQAGDTATVMNTMIACTIDDEAALALYEFVLTQWEDYMMNAHLQHDGEESKHESTQKPDRPENYKRLLAVSLYIGNVFGQYDNLSFQQKSRMSFLTPLSCRCGIDTTSLVERPFTAQGADFIKSILKDLIWDMVQAHWFTNALRRATKRKAPLFEEYAEDIAEFGSYEPDNDEEETNIDELIKATAAGEGTLANSTKSEILERSIFNIMHEMAERYARASTKTRWFEVPPIQPKALLDMDSITKDAHFPE